MNAAKKSERARLQHAVDCINEMFAAAEDMGDERLARVLRCDPHELDPVERRIRSGMLYLYVQLAEETAHMGDRVVGELVELGVDMWSLTARDRNLGAHEADKLDADDLYDMMARGWMEELCDAFSKLIAELARDNAYFFKGQLEREAAAAIKGDVTDAKERYEAELRSRLEQAEREMDDLRGAW